jgi:hypothetical protein
VLFRKGRFLGAWVGLVVVVLLGEVDAKWEWRMENNRRKGERGRSGYEERGVL